LKDVKGLKPIKECGIGNDMIEDSIGKNSEVT